MSDEHGRPFATGRMRTDDGASLYWEQSGRRDGVPAVWLHGGPGGRLGSGAYRRFFDPGHYRVVGLDQRGAGLSSPSVAHQPEALTAITTGRLIADLECLRLSLGIESWVVAAASWGTTLALAYSLAHPERVDALALLAVTTTSREEVDWITEGVGRFFPEEWELFERASLRRPGERVVEAYARRLAGGSESHRHEAALAWDRWESVHPSLSGAAPSDLRHQDRVERLEFATMVTHMWAHDAFLVGEQAIIPRIPEIGHIPGALVHGRGDISSPAITAWRLHRAWPQSTLTIVDGEAHGGSRQDAALRRALDGFRALPRRNERGGSRAGGEVPRVD